MQSLFSSIWNMPAHEKTSPCSLCSCERCLLTTRFARTKALRTQKKNIMVIFFVLRERKLRHLVFSAQSESSTFSELWNVRETWHLQAGEQWEAPILSRVGCCHWSSACAAAHSLCSCKNNTLLLILASAIIQSNSRHPQCISWGEYFSFACVVPRLQCHSVHQS